MLGASALHQELVVLYKSGIVQELNDYLSSINHTRNPKFQGSYIGDANWGFLVEDMRPDGASDFRNIRHCDLLTISQIRTNAR